MNQNKFIIEWKEKKYDDSFACQKAIQNAQLQLRKCSLLFNSHRSCKKYEKKKKKKHQKTNL